MQQEVVTFGIDLAKNLFRVHSIGADGEVLVCRQCRRAEVLKFFAASPPCLVGMDAYASAHHRSRELRAFDHDLRLMPPPYVKPCVKRRKTKPPVQKRYAKLSRGRQFGSCSEERRPAGGAALQTMRTETSLSIYWSRRKKMVGVATIALATPRCERIACS